MNTLLWIVRILVLLVVIRMVLRLLFGRRQFPSRASRGALERSGGTLVRDPQCGTYVPQSSAIAVGSGASTLYFCSAECRDAYARAQPQRA